MKTPETAKKSKTRVRQAETDAVTKRVAFSRMAKFCEAMAERGNETHSLMIAGLSRKAMLSYCEQWPELEEQRLEAVRQSVDKLRQAAWTRAVDGVETPVFQRGQRLGTVKQFSDQLLALLLKGEDPNKYADRRQISGPDGGPIQIDLKLDIDAARRRLIEKLARKR